MKQDQRSESEASGGRDGGEGAAGGGLSRREFVAAGAGAVAAAAATLSSSSARAGTSYNPIYRIHPAIGLARVGNLDPSVAYFIGPETPGEPPSGEAPGTSVPPYKVNGLVKPMAARFRIFEYARGSDGRLYVVGEVNLSTPGVAAITWTAHLANKKASMNEENGPTGETLPPGPLRNPTVTDRRSLESDFGPRSISGANQGPVEFRPGGSGGTYPETYVKGPDGVTPVIDYLGQLRTDAFGRLILLGGKGHSASNLSPAPTLTHWSNNNNWFDDIGDGPVTATVTLTDGRVIPMDEAGHAWALVSPPDFAPRIGAAVNLYDVLYDMGVRNLPIPADNALYDDGGPLARLRVLNELWAQNQASPDGSGFEFGGGFLADYTSEIQPILTRAVEYVYVTGLVNFKHSSMLDPSLADPSAAHAKDRSGVFVYLRPPEEAATNNDGGPRTMPRLYGDNWYQGSVNFHFTFGDNGTGNKGGGGQSFPTPAHIPQYQRYMTLLPTQYGLMRSWQSGNFVAPSGAEPPAQITPHGLDRAVLENCIGGPFYPGIEAGWQIRNPALFIEPFRLDPNATSQYIGETGKPVVAGHFSRQMAVPWQADFNDCVRLLNLGWWPSQRPDDVFLNATDPLNQRVPWARPTTKYPSGSTTSSHDDMAANWWKFGFVVETPAGSGAFIETERAATVP